MKPRPAVLLAQRYAVAPTLAHGDTVLIRLPGGKRRFRLDLTGPEPQLRRVMKVTKKPQASLATPVPTS